MAGRRPRGRLPRRHRPGERRRRRARDTTRTSTGSRSPARTRSAWRSTRASPRTFPKPTICEMGGKNPAIVTGKADLDMAADGVTALGVRARRAEVLGLLARLRRARRSTTSSSPAGRARPRRSRSATRSSATTYMGPVIDEDAVDAFEQRGRRGAQERHGRHCGGERLTDGDARPRHLRAADRRRGARATRGSGRTSCSCRFVAVAPVDSLDEAFTLANDTELGLTAGLFSEDEPRSTRSSTASRPASSTSTAAPARPPARGRACSRSAAGRARARTARPAAARTTSSSTCASRAERWSRSDARRIDGDRPGASATALRGWSPSSRAPRPRAWIERDRQVTSPSLAARVPARARRGRGLGDRGRRRQPVPRLQRRASRSPRPATATPRWSTRSDRRPGS